MIVAAGSMWRNMAATAAAQLDRWYNLHRALETRGDSLVCLFVENDSTDDTWHHLHEFAACGHVPTILEQVSDGCPHWPSTDHPDRWRHLAWVANHTLSMLDAVPDADVFLYCESDLGWTVEDMVRLIDSVGERRAVAAANMTGDRWYDSWGTRKDGVFFTGPAPYHPAFTGEPMVVDSTCGAIALEVDIARRTRFQPEDCYVGWCREIGEITPVWLDPRIKVQHP